MATRAQIDAIVTKMQGTRDLSPGGIAAMKELAASLQELTAVKTSDQLEIGTAYADVTDTGLPVVAYGVYAFDFRLILDADATTTGIYASVNGPASPASVHYTLTYWNATPATASMIATAYDTAATHVNSQGTSQAIYVVNGILRNGANAGTLIARACREAVGSGPNARAGSFGRAIRLA